MPLAPIPRSLRSLLLAGVLAPALAFAVAERAGAAPEGTMTWGVHVTLASRWLDPAETEALVTPFMVLYAHPRRAGEAHAGRPCPRPSLAESWTVSRDGLVYEFVLRKNARFHDGYPGHRRRREVLLRALPGRGGQAPQGPRQGGPDRRIPSRVRFVLKEPWPDFMTFYGTTATGAAWVVPKKYVEQVGEEGFKKAPDRRGALQVRVLQSRASSWCSRPSRATGASRPPSSGWSSAPSPTRPRAPPR